MRVCRYICQFAVETCRICVQSSNLYPKAEFDCGNGKRLQAASLTPSPTTLAPRMSHQPCNLSPHPHLQRSYGLSRPTLASNLHQYDYYAFFVVFRLMVQRIPPLLDLILSHACPSIRKAEWCGSCYSISRTDTLCPLATMVPVRSDGSIAGGLALLVCSVSPWLELLNTYIPSNQASFKSASASYI